MPEPVDLVLVLVLRQRRAACQVAKDLSNHVGQASDGR
jgi:hypothetical protein